MKQLTIMIANIPEGTSLHTPIYMASNMNGWKTNDPAFQLIWQPESGYFILSLDNCPDMLEFKFTRGSWATEEMDDNNKRIMNRLWASNSNNKFYITSIANWKDMPNWDKAKAVGKVYLWQKDLLMPQLNRRRNVWVYLPPNYEENKSFPVIYMHDAQNVFEGIPSAYGKWNASHTLNRLYHLKGFSCIVVAIEHGNELRHSEYSPWPHKTRGGGEGKDYMEFVVKTLKPLVDSSFKTLPTAKDTCIMGSSMGGLISTYAALKYGDVFGKVGAFSPAYWWCEEIYEFAANQPFNYVQKLVLLAGGKETEWYLADTLAMYSTLVDNNYYEDKIILDFFEWGGHEEAFWAMEFDNALDFLFEDEIGIPFNSGTSIVNFDEENCQIAIMEAFERFELLNPYGKIILKRMGEEPVTIPLKKHWKGNYIYKCYLKSGKILTRKISL